MGTATVRCVPVPEGATVYTFDDTPGPTADDELSEFFDFLGTGANIGGSGWRIDVNAQNPNDDTSALHTTSDGGQLENSGLGILDFNGDGGSNIADAVGSLNFLFGGGGPHVLGEGCTEIEGDCVANCQ